MFRLCSQKIGSSSFVRFALVGGLGFCVDAGLLATLVHGLGVSPFWARGVSFPLAVLVTWAGHILFTFRQWPSRPLRNLLGYCVSSVGGTIINLAIYTFFLMHVPLMLEMPVVALAIGALAGLVFNYAMARTLLFKTPSVHE